MLGIYQRIINPDVSGSRNAQLASVLASTHGMIEVTALPLIHRDICINGEKVLTYLPIHSLTHSLTHSFTHSLTHSLTHTH